MIDRSQNKYHAIECPHCGYRITLRAAQAITDYRIEGLQPEDTCPICSSASIMDFTPRIIKETYLPGGTIEMTEC